MRLNSSRVEQALNQFDAQVIPDSHPAMPQLKGLYGDHTFFLSANGLNIVEPIGPSDAGIQEGNVINLADWADSKATSLKPHEPEATEVVVAFADDEPEEPDLMN